MKLYDGGSVVFTVLIVVVVVGYLSSFWLGDDNAIEEVAENILEKHVGIDLDLTPNSPEK